MEMCPTVPKQETFLFYLNLSLDIPLMYLGFAQGFLLLKDDAEKGLKKNVSRKWCYGKSR